MFKLHKNIRKYIINIRGFMKDYKYIIKLISSIFIFLLISIFYSIINIKYAHLNSSAISLKYYIIGLTIYFIYQLIISKTITNNIPSNEEMVRNLFKSNIFIAFISACFLAPILEEILFRFTILKCSKNKYIFLLTSSILFSIFHVTNLQSIVQIFFLFSYLILSFTLSYILYKSKNICNSIIIHSIHNLFMALLLFLGG